MKRYIFIVTILFIICNFSPLNAQTYYQADEMGVELSSNNSQPSKGAENNASGADILPNEKTMQNMKEIEKRREEAEERIKQVEARTIQIEARKIAAAQLKKQLEQAKQKEEEKSTRTNRRRKRGGKLKSSGSIKLN